MSLLSYQSVFAQVETCRFSDADIEGVEVGQIGDRQIYTLFTGHLINANVRVHRIINSYESKNAIALLDQLMNELQSVIASEQSDARKIIELAESGRIDWIGIESTNGYTSYANVTDNSLNDRYLFRRVSNYLDYQDFISRNFHHLPDWSADKTAQLLFLAFPAYVIVHANYPEIFHKIEVYPLEDRNLRREASRLRDERDHWNELILRDSHVTGRQYLEIILFTNEYLIPRPRLISDSEIESFLNRLGIPEEAHTTFTNIRMFMKVSNERILSILRRDEVVVQSILDLPDNGLVIFGTAHEHGIKQGLITACQNETNSP